MDIKELVVRVERVPGEELVVGVYYKPTKFEMVPVRIYKGKKARAMYHMLTGEYLKEE